MLVTGSPIFPRNQAKEVALYALCNLTAGFITRVISPRTHEPTRLTCERGPFLTHALKTEGHGSTWNCTHAVNSRRTNEERHFAQSVAYPRPGWSDHSWPERRNVTQRARCKYRRAGWIASPGAKPGKDG